MERKEIVSRTDVGFVYVRSEQFSIIKNLDGGVKKVPDRFVDDLIRIARGDVSVGDFPPDFAETVDELRDEGYIYPGPVVELQRPEFTLAPRLLLTITVYVPFVYIIYVEFNTVRTIVRSISVTPPAWFLLYGLLFSLPWAVVHEYGHFREARKHVPVSVGVGTINGLLPAFKTDTTETWLLCRQHRIWINLAGVTYHGVAMLPLAIVYFYDISLPLPGFDLSLKWLIYLLVTTTVLGLLNPIVQGDGYLIMTDLLNEYNIRQQAIESYENREMNLYGLYGLLSYGLVNLYLVLGVVFSFRIWGWLVGIVLNGLMFLFVAFEFGGLETDELVSSEPGWVSELRAQIPGRE